MNSRLRLFLIPGLLLGGACSASLVPTAAAADQKEQKEDKVKSDLLPPDKRRATVELGQHLTRPPTPEPLPADLAQPFNPPGFDLPDRTETPPPVASGPTTGPAAGSTGVGAGRGEAGAPAAAAPAPGEREKLDSLAAKLNPTGTILLGTNRLLSFGTKNVRIGSPFTVSTNGQDYVLLLVAVDSTTFTVRLGDQEVTRPIKPGK